MLRTCLRAAFVVLAFILLWTAEVGLAITMEVEIDIKPGSDENPINLKSMGVITVAILTTDYFDATTVDPMSVEFGPGEATECHERGHIEDVDEDGDLDMVLHFRTQEAGIEWEDTEAYLTGYTMDGMAIEGSDVIMMVPPEGEENGDISSEDEDEGPGKGKAKGKSKIKVRGKSNANAEALDGEDEDEAEDEDSGKGKGKAKGKARGRARGKGKGKGNEAPAKGVRISPTVWGRMKVK
jgi:hypothetical protein